MGEIYPSQDFRDALMGFEQCIIEKSLLTKAQITNNFNKPEFFMYFCEKVVIKLVYIRDLILTVGQVFLSVGNVSVPCNMVQYIHLSSCECDYCDSGA